MQVSVPSDFSATSHPRGVIPAKAGIHSHHEIPAFAGMTSRFGRRPSIGSAAVAARRLFKRVITALLLALSLTAPALAIDPPYQRQMERLAEVMGSLYYLQPLCKTGTEDWRAQMSELIGLDEPDEDRRQRLAGAFNTGYTGFARLHRQCTPSSREALTRLLVEAQQLARGIHTRFAE